MKAKKRARNRIESENNYKIVIALNNVDRYVSYRLAIASVVFKVKKEDAFFIGVYIFASIKLNLVEQRLIDKTKPPKQF